MKKLFAAAVIAVALPAFAGETHAPTTAETKPAAVKKAATVAAKKGEKKDVATAGGEETKTEETKPATK